MTTAVGQERTQHMSSIRDELSDRFIWQAGLAELVATAFLSLAALISGGPYAVGLVLAVFLFAIGSISGGSLNPAVTVGLMVARHVSVVKGVIYIVAEVVGAYIGLGLAPLIHPLAVSYTAATPAGEFLGFGILMLAVLATAGGYLPRAASGLAIGGGLLAGLLITGGIINPAIALVFGVAVAQPWSIWAPIVAAVVFAGIFRAFATFNAIEPVRALQVPPTDLPSRQAA